MYSKYVKLIWEVQPKDTELEGRETFTSDLGMKAGSLTGVGLSEVGTRALQAQKKEEQGHDSKRTACTEGEQ